MVILQVEKLSKHFGGLSAIHQMDFEMLDSEILGIIGPNGAGKSTLFNVICGFLRPSSGTVVFNGEDIAGFKVHDIARRGMGRTFQRLTLFEKSTVFDNVVAGFHLNYRVGLWKTFLHTKAAREEEKIAKQRATDILDYMGLKSFKNELAQNLPHGFQRIVEISIALSTNPKLLLLDEPVSGMNEAETESVVKLIRHIRNTGIAIIVVEHDMVTVKNICDRIIVLNYGRKIAEGSPYEVFRDKEVIKAYLGEEDKADA